jgi:hypothetical protein
MSRDFAMHSVWLIPDKPAIVGEDYLDASSEMSCVDLNALVSLFVICSGPLTGKFIYRGVKKFV